MTANDAVENGQDKKTEPTEAQMEEFRRFLEESVYTPLYLHLKSIPSEQNSISLSINEVESILGTSLPSLAGRTRSWWANSSYNKHSIFWMLAGWRANNLDTVAGTVTFVRDERVLDRVTVARGGWSKLKRFFKGLPPKQHQIALTFEELGKLRGMALPATAFHDRPWWANTRSSQGQAWMSAGWELESVYLNSKIAVFRRKGSIHNVDEIREYVKSILEGSHGRSQPGADTLKNWVSVCRRLGWYFEAKTIYECGGLRTDLLRESDRMELEEDYEVSKRELNAYLNSGLKEEQQ